MKNLFLSLLSLAFSAVSFSQNTLANALELLLKQNKRPEAARILNQLETSSPDGHYASLALAMQEVSNDHYALAWDYLQKFLAKTDNQYPYIYAFWNSGVFGNGNNIKGLNSFMEKLMKDPQAPSTLRAMAAGNLATAEYNKGNIKDAKELYNSYGEISNWSTVGVFENVSGSGFNKEYGITDKPDKNAVFKNNKGADIKWFPMGHNLGHWYDFEYHYDINNALLYAQTFLNSPSEQTVIMKVGVSGSVKIWINDFLVAQDAEERNTNMDLYNYVVKLKTGTNRILVQMGSSEIANNNFMIRFTDMKDQLITGLQSQSEYTAYKKETVYEVKSLPFFAEEYFEKRLEKDPSNFFDQMMLISIYNHNDKKYQARKIAQQLKRTYPTGTLVIEKVTETYSRDKNNTELTRELESVKTNDPESLYGLILRYNDATNKEDYDEAWKLLDIQERIYGSNSGIIKKRVTIYGQKKEYEQLIKLLQQNFSKYPDDEYFITMQYLLAQNTTKDPKKTASILKNYLEDHFDDGIYNMLASNYMESGKKEEALKMYKKYIDYFPHATGKYVALSDNYFNMQDYENAQEWINLALQRAPYVGQYHYKHGLILGSQKKNSLAINSMKQAISYNPGNFDARKKLRELQGKKDLFESFAKNAVDELIKNTPAASEYPNDHSIYLLEDMQQVVYPENGATEEKYELLIKIFNQAGIDYWKELSIPYNSYTEELNIEKAELIKKDGTKVKSESDGNEVVFSSLEMGDIIHLLYKKEVIHFGKLAEHFWETFSFNGGLPSKSSRYSLIVPANRQFTWKLYNSEMKPVIKDVDEYKMYVWEKKDIPAIKSEPYMPAYADIQEKIVITSIADWNYVANWYRDLSSIKAKSDFEVKEKVKELLGGKEKLTDLQKAKLIYNYISENFSYSNIPFLHSALTPQRASRTLQTKLGDCKDLSTLFVAMCQEAGLNANLVLVDTRDNGDKNLDIPTIGFNHCIAQLKADNKNYLLELTDKYLPFGAMSTDLLNANGLYIPKENETASTPALSKLNTNNRPQNTIERNSIVKFSGNNIDMERKTRRSGFETSTTRNGYKDLGDEDRRKEMNELLSGEFNKKITFKELRISQLDVLTDTLIFENSFAVENFASDLLGMKIFKLPWSDAYKTQEFIALDKRTYPFNLWQFSSTPYDKEVMTVILPVGKKLAEVPVNVSFSCSSMSYSLNFQVKPDRIIAAREVKYLKDQIPVSEYAAFKEFVSKMNDADSKQYGFK
jgi:hypothetical protein